MTLPALATCPSELRRFLRSQGHVQQDLWLYEHVFGPGCPHAPRNADGTPRQGIFVDVGAFGEEGSNTFFYEFGLGWRGVLIEPNPLQVAQLQKHRGVPVVACAIDATPGTKPFLQICGINQQLSGLVNNYDPRWQAMLDAQHKHHGNEQNKIDVPCRTLQDVLDEHGITHVDYLSIDTEGSEMAVLKSIDWARMHIVAVTVEDAHSDLPAPAYMASVGYDLVHKCWPDLFFVKRQ